MMKYVDGIPIFGTHQSNTIEQIRDVASRAERAALMADGHFGYFMPVGGVVAYRGQVSVAGVGFDIACGNAAIRTDLKLEDISGITREEFVAAPHLIYANGRMNQLADDIFHTITFGVGGINHAADAPRDDPVFADGLWYLIPYENGCREILKDNARKQLGSVGSGNHYVDVMVDEDGWVWVGVHFGSRGLGHTIATNFMALAQGEPWGTKVRETEALLDIMLPLGMDYWGCMTLAGRYANAGRLWAVRKCVELLGGQEVELVHNYHNFAWEETHPNPATGELEELIVVRKGATPAGPGVEGFVGGSVGDDAVILRGAQPEGFIDRQQQMATLCSTVHGAGRVMSRTEAAGKRDRKTGQLKVYACEVCGGDEACEQCNGTCSFMRPGKVSPQMMDDWIHERGVVLRGGGLDESPHVYRRLHDVLVDQGGTIEVLHRLRPVIVCMAPGRG